MVASRRLRRRRGTKRYSKKVTYLQRYLRPFRKRTRNKVLGIPRPTVAFPRVRVVRHKYVENITIPAASAAGLLRQYNYCCNSMFDPNSTGVGHQPLFRDEMAAVYTKYTVVSSYIKVTLSQTDTDQQNWGIVCSKDTTLNVNPTVILEEYGGNKPFIPAQRNSPKILTKSYSAKAFYKVKNINLILGDDVQRVDVGSNPGVSAIAYFNIWSGPLDPLVTLPATKAQVELILVCAWQFPMDAVQS